MKKKTLLALFGLMLVVALVSGCTATGAPNSNGPSATQTPDSGMGSASTVEGSNTGASKFDELFINMMVPHHQGAVEMAKIAQERAEHPEIKEMANAIVAGQDEEIKQMKNWKQSWFGSSDTPSMREMPSLEEMPGMGGMGHAMDMQAEVDQLKNAPEPFDLAFMDAMIPHHQSAIDAAQQALNKAGRPEIKDLAQKIIDAQQKEIDQMKAWRETWYPDAPAP